MNWYVYRFIFAKAIRTMHFDGPVTDRIPVKQIKGKTDEALYDEVVRSATRLTDLHKKLTLVTSEHEQTSLNRQIVAAAQVLDSGVYRLFDLTPPDIALIESSTVPLCRPFVRNEQSSLRTDSLAFDV